MESKGLTSSDSSSAANSEEYEIISNKKVEEIFEPPKMEGDETAVKKTMDECLSVDDNSETNLDTSLVNENRNVLEDIENNHTIFHNINYLGATKMDEPKNERLIHGIIKEYNALHDLTDSSSDEEKTSVDVILAVPKSSEDKVILHESISKKFILEFEICRIIFFARGTTGSPEQSCFAFTCAHQDEDSRKTIFQCHIFRCQVVEAVTKVFVSFAQAFRKKESKTEDQVDSSNEECFLFEVTMEIKEKSSETNSAAFELVPRQKGIFKLRSNIEKKVVVSVQQLSQNSCKLSVERCFGMLVSPGRNVRHADMQLLEHVTMATTPTGDSQDQDIVHVITGVWDPRETSFAVLNKETPHDLNSVYLTIAADLVMTHVAEPVRFVIETKARILPQNERYWYYTKKSLVKQFNVRVKRREDNKDLFDVVGIDKSEEVELNRSKLSLSLQLANLTASTWSSLKSPPIASSGAGYGDDPDSFSPTMITEDDDDNEEPLLSGFGDVSKECSGTELDSWSQVLSEWSRDNPKLYPKILPTLIKNGVPEALRGEVWQRITGASVQQEEIIEAYRVLITKESPDEKVILRDIHRTFPAHEFFKEAGGIGQESLYRISKAYSVYDSEIGYCQGQSFLIAALLLQMPEEQAFGVLVKVMHELGLRDMFRENFEQLQLRLYQLDRLVENMMPDLHVHFQECGLESHMFASQWFLTVFTAKFPLFLVFRVLDVFLLQGFDAIFQVALAMLKVTKKDLLNQDFEGLMKYFRVNIPKTYRNEENAKQLLRVAIGIKLKRLSKYEKEWLAIKEAERQREDPVIRLERENKKLLSDNMRLDTENDNLARELVNSKIEMRKDIDAIEDKKDFFEKEYESTKSMLSEAVDEKSRLTGETEALKGLLKHEVEKLDSEIAIKNKVIADYKAICSQLSEKLEKAQQQKPSKEKPNEVSSDETKTETPVSENQEIEKWMDRVKELEMELAQTKLALVETKCRNQELTHQIAVHEESSSQSATAASSSNKKWFAKTLYSIKESAVASSGFNSKPTSSITKSTSVDVLKSLPEND